MTNALGHGSFPHGGIVPRAEPGVSPLVKKGERTLGQIHVGVGEQVSRMPIALVEENDLPRGQGAAQGAEKATDPFVVVHARMAALEGCLGLGRQMLESRYVEEEAVIVGRGQTDGQIPGTRLD